MRQPTPRLPRLGSPAWLALQTGLPAEAALDPALVRYAARTRRWRWIGVVIAYVVAVLWGSFGPRDAVALTVWPLLVVGWLAGGLLPELFVRHRGTGEVRVALVASRSPMRYVTATARRWLIGSYVLTGVAVVLALIVGQPLIPTDLLPIIGCVPLAVIASIAVVRIAHRGHPAGSAAEVAVDDAIRVLAITRIVSAWIGLQFMIAWALVPHFRNGPWDALTAIVLVACLVGVLVAWAWVPTRLLRSVRPPAMAISP